MKTSKWTGILLAGAILAFLAAPAARAGSSWVTVAELQTGGDAKEVQVNKEISHVLIKCLEGTVIINTVVIREGGKKTPITVARKLQKGEAHVIDLDRRRTVTGLRISDASRGRYRVEVRK